MLNLGYDHLAKKVEFVGAQMTTAAKEFYHCGSFVLCFKVTSGPCLLSEDRAADGRSKIWGIWDQAEEQVQQEPLELFPLRPPA